MSRYDTGRRGRSSDGGYTWGLMGNLPFSSSWFFANVAGSTSRFVAISTSMIRATTDFGQTWLNREGNIQSLIPIPSLDLIKVVSG